MTIKKVVLAYSGGLDTSVIIRWLIETYRCEVIAFVANLGQKEAASGGLEAIRDKALKTGASRVYMEDLREEFVRDFIFPALKGGAIYEGTYLLGTSLARPLIAKKQVEIAARENADAVAHGATGKGNDQVRFELTYMALNPSIRIIAPWREWTFRSRTDLIQYAQLHGIPVAATLAKPYSSDENLYHISYEGGILEDPWAEAPEEIFILTTSPEKAPDQAEYIEVEFLGGVPSAVNGEKMTPATLLAALNRKGGAHGIGRVDMVENRYVGMKSRGVYETPGGTLLHIAHRALESITLDREVLHLRDGWIPRFAEMIYYGYWYSPEMKVMQKAVEATQENVTGTVRLKLYKGNCQVVGRKAPFSLYRPDMATFEAEEVYRQKDAEGFIRLNALRLKIAALAEQERLRGETPGAKS